jgi:Tfp pilus assembly protein PilF
LGHKEAVFKTLVTRLTERRALNAFALGDYAKAERLFGVLRGREGDTARVLRNLGLARMAQGDLAGAEAFFVRETELYGPTADRLQALADVAYLSGDRERAARRLADSLAHPQCSAPELCRRRAAICAEPAAFDRAMRGKEHFARGNALLAADDADGALAAFREAVAADPTDFAALNNIGGILLNRKGDPAGAARAFAEALALQELPMLKANLAMARARAEAPRG